MSIEQRGRTNWEPSDALDDRLGQPEELRFPEGWTLSESWQRAQTEADNGAPAENDAERIVWLEEGDPHRVVFALSGDQLLGECSCDGYHYHGFCAHLASCWWRWVRGRIVVTHLDTGRNYRYPPSWLRLPDGDHGDLDEHRERDLSGLTAAELDAFLTCELGTTGVREYARKTDRAPGTVGNLLARARKKEGSEMSQPGTCTPPVQTPVGGCLTHCRSRRTSDFRIGIRASKTRRGDVRHE